MAPNTSPLCNGDGNGNGQTRWLTEPDEYVCTLSEVTRKTAREELFEEESRRKQAIEEMRHWIVNNPRILNCRLDARFLLRFLRTKKFSCPQSQDALERYLLLKMTYGPQAFMNLDCLNPRMDHLFSLGYLIPLPGRDTLNRRVILYRPSVFDPYKYNKEDMIRIHAIAYDTLLENEENQVHGFVHYVDAQGVSFPYLTLFTPKEAVRIIKNGERTIPMRHKEGIGFNINPKLKFAVDWGFTLIQEKFKKRIKVCTNIEESYSFIDRKMLPKEYGGERPMAELIDLWKKELLTGRELLLSSDAMCVNVEMFSPKAREGAVSALRESCANQCGNTNELQGITGSFRKLEVD